MTGPQPKVIAGSATASRRLRKRVGIEERNDGPRKGSWQPWLFVEIRSSVGKRSLSTPQTGLSVKQPHGRDDADHGRPARPIRAERRHIYSRELTVVDYATARSSY
jgi:hypothetical protein